MPTIVASSIRICITDDFLEDSGVVARIADRRFKGLFIGKSRQSWRILAKKIDPQILCS